MEVDLVSFESDEVSKISLDEGIFGGEYCSKILSLVINWQLAKKRGGNHKTKGISDISGTTRKPYKQKGTGRARQGSLRSPQFRGGAVIFGPVVRSHAFKVNKKVRNLGVKMALSLKCTSGTLSVLENGDFLHHKTSDLIKWMNGMPNFSASSSFLFIGGDADEKLRSAVRNIPRAKHLNRCAINVYDLIRHDYVLLNKDAISDIESRYSS